MGWVTPPPASTPYLHTVLKVTEESDDVLTESDNGIVSDPEECILQEERLESRVAALKRKEGLSSDRTLKQAFKLMDCLIGQYKLNRTDEILAELAPVCERIPRPPVGSSASAPSSKLSVAKRMLSAHGSRSLRLLAACGT